MESSILRATATAMGRQATESNQLTVNLIAGTETSHTYVGWFRFLKQINRETPRARSAWKYSVVGAPHAPYQMWLLGMSTTCENRS